MDWKTVGGYVKKGAPLLGTILGGPAGAAAGGAVSLICSALGIGDSTPESVMAQLQGDPDAMVKLRQIESTHQIELGRIALEMDRLEVELQITQTKETNATMRVEAVSEHWPQYSWRPAWGFGSMLAFFLVCWYLGDAMKAAMARQDAATALASLPAVVMAVTALFGIPGAILGVAAWGRNKLKIT